jgi:hypothetical protein
MKKNLKDNTEHFGKWCEHFVFGNASQYLHSVNLPPIALRKILEVFMIGLFLGLSSLQPPFEGKPVKMWNEAELGACHLTQPPAAP